MTKSKVLMMLRKEKEKDFSTSMINLDLISTYPPEIAMKSYLKGFVSP